MGLGAPGSGRPGGGRRPRPVRGAPWDRAVGIALAGLSVIAHFPWLPHAPVRPIVLLVIDGFVIWAPCAPRRESRAA